VRRPHAWDECLSAATRMDDRTEGGFGLAWRGRTRTSWAAKPPPHRNAAIGDGAKVPVHAPGRRRCSGLAATVCHQRLPSRRLAN